MGQQSEPQSGSDRPALSAVAAVGVLLLLVGLSVWVLWSEPAPPAIVRTTLPSPSTESEPAIPELPADLGPVPAIPLARTPFEPASKSPSTNPAFTPITGLPSAYLAGLPKADPALVAWLKDWEARSLNGEKSTPEQMRELSALLEITDLQFGALYGLGQSFGDVEGPTAAQPFYALAVRRAEADMKGLPARGQQAKAYYWPLTLMYSSLYKVPDYASSQLIWEMLSALADAGSQEEYVCRFMDYEMLCQMGRYDESYRSFSALAKEYDEAPLANGNRGFRAEMDYMMGYSRFCQQQYAEAASLLEKSTAFEATHTAHVYRLLILAASEAGQAEVAERAFAELTKRNSLARCEAIELAAELERSKAPRR